MSVNGVLKLNYSNIEKSITGNTMKGDLLRTLTSLPLTQKQWSDVNHIAGMMREPRVAKTVVDIAVSHAEHIVKMQSQANDPVKI